MEKYLILNRLTCLNCGEELISYNRHDYKTCKCENETFIDGGLDYCRYGGKDLSKIETNCIYSDAPFEEIRKNLHRGSYGKNGDEPLKYVRLCDINEEWLEALIQYEEKLRPNNKYLKFYNDEREYRKNNN